MWHSHTNSPPLGILARNLIVIVVVATLTKPTASAEKRVPSGTLVFHITNQENTLTPARIHLYSKEGEPQIAPDCPNWNDHFVSNGETTLKLKPGIYRWEMERGPEHKQLSGTVRIGENTTVHVNAQFNRLPSLPNNGLVDEHWYSGDLHVHRPVQHMKQLMEAEDLNFATVIQWWNTPAERSAKAETTVYQFADHQIYSTMAGEDEREGGALLYFNLKQPLDLTVQNREFPSPMVFLERAREMDQRVWVDVEKTFWWDVPLWAAIAEPDSIGIAHNHMHRSGVLDNEAWGKPRDLRQYPGPRGNGQWTQDIYYHLLNCGFRIPPSAGSASGVLPNPLGHNRVYVQIGDQPFTRETWFDGLRQGKCFVTNGPLLRVKANGQWPGANLNLNDKKHVNFEIKLTSRTPVSRLEVIHNGETVESIPCNNEISQTFQHTVSLENHGWVLIRAVGSAAHTYQFASTAPWYLGSGYPDPPQGHSPETLSAKSVPYISPESAKFFLDWINERIDRVKLHLPSREQESSVLEYHLKAKTFWEQRLQVAQKPQQQQLRTLQAIGYQDAITLLLELKQLSENATDRISGNLAEENVQRTSEAQTSAIAKTERSATNFAENRSLISGERNAIERAIRRAYLAHNQQEIEDALAPLVWLKISINPESRVKVQATNDRVTLLQGVPLFRLARIENAAGITAQLNLSAIDLSTEPPKKAGWFEPMFVTRKDHPDRLHGGLHQYKIVKATTLQSGIREVRIVGDAGQGTQDLGFRATADLMLETLE
ncbi:MAG: CehA/McbA family metallohydrolase [Rubripirellula sp.]|nr:CehA/McbA family metallohydrolase [Rubripirellula sp.]